MRPPLSKFSRGERGQILVFMALATMFVITGVMAISIDVGVAEVSKRRLQTVADAAALAAATEKSKGGTDAAALQKARDMLAASGVVPPASNSGSGASLVEGIEVGSDIRVALRRTVGTYFANIFGVGNVVVSARAHARSSSSGVMPIAVKRFSDGNTSFPVGPPPDNDNGIIRDYLEPEAVDGISSWPDPLTATASPAAEFSPVGARDPTKSGRVICIVGDGCLANVRHGNDFRFFVAPDVRDLTHQTITVLPPADPGGDPNSLKGLEAGYISMKGYPGPFAPPWTEIAALSGNVSGPVAHAFDDVFNPGDVVTAMIYNGTVFEQPDFNLMITPISSTPGDIDVTPSGSPASYTVTIEQTSATAYKQFVAPGVQLSVHGLEQTSSGMSTGVRWSSWQITEGSHSNDNTATGPWNKMSSLASPGGGNVSSNLYILHDNATQGTHSFQVRAYDPTNGKYRLASGTVRVGPVTNAYTMSASQAFQSAVVGSGNTSYSVRLDSHNGYHPTVYIGPTGMPGTVSSDQVRWCAPSNNPSSPEPNCGIAGPADVSLSVSSSSVNLNGASATFTVTANVGAGASNGEWLIRVPTWDGVTYTWDDDPTDPTKRHPDVQYVYLSLYIKPVSDVHTQIAGSDFVYILGYANFVIDHMDANSVYGYAISGLEDHPEKLGLGMKPRLVGWFQ